MRQTSRGQVVDPVVAGRLVGNRFSLCGLRLCRLGWLNRLGRLARLACLELDGDRCLLVVVLGGCARSATSLKTL